MKLTKQRLKEIIKEELEVPAPQDEAEDVWQSLQDMILEIDGLRKVIEGISMEHGAFVHVNTYAKKAHGAIAQLSDKVQGAILERDRWNK